MTHHRIANLWKSNTEQPFINFFYTLFFNFKTTASVSGTIPYELTSAVQRFVFNFRVTNVLASPNRPDKFSMTRGLLILVLRLWLLNVSMMLLVIYKSDFSWFLRTSDFFMRKEKQHTGDHGIHHVLQVAETLPALEWAIYLDLKMKIIITVFI